MIRFIRPVGALLLAIAAVVVFFAMEPAALEDPDELVANQVEYAMSLNESNEDSSDNVYQQQVTNGWVARDLLQIIAQQSGPEAFPAVDQRPAALLTLAVLGIALMAGTMKLSTNPEPGPQVRKADRTPGASPDPSRSTSPKSEGADAVPHPTSSGPPAASAGSA